MQNYRLSSSALTGRASRTLSEAFGCHPNDPVHPMPGPHRPSLRDFFAAVGQIIGRVFGR